MARHCDNRRFDIQPNRREIFHAIQLTPLLQVYFHLIDDAEFGVSITSFNKLLQVNEAIFKRICYPFTPSYYMKGFKQFVTKVNPKVKLRSNLFKLFGRFLEYVTIRFHPFSVHLSPISALRSLFTF